MVSSDRDDQNRFGPYRILRHIRSGGMGSVFEAEDTGLGHRVALKLLHPHVARSPGAAARFLREGRAAARIRHPHVVQVFALGAEGDTPYLAMELLDGDDLSQIVAREGRLSVDDALELVLPVIAAVAAAHDAGIIHRDLKPSNVCTVRDPRARPWPKVVDFGVSKVITGDGANDVTLAGTVIGTAAYMAPEHARASCNASFRSDQYSLAVLLYHCVTGGLPFSGRSMYELVEAIMTAPLAPPSARVEGIPRGFDEAMLGAMSRDPEERFSSVRAFGAALLPLASERIRLALSAELQEAEAIDVNPAAERSRTGPLEGSVTSEITDSGVSACLPPRALIRSRVIHDSEELLVAEIGSICVAAWRQGVTPHRFELQRSGLADVVERRTAGIGFLCLIEETSWPPPDHKLRRASSEMISARGIACVAVVVEATGFSAAIIRSVIAGITILTRSQSDVPVSVFSSVRDAIVWMDNFVAIDSIDALLLSLFDIRRPMRASG
jgi:tRNA A-37 threonylcarbamoyl transferase component Bud32